MITTTKKKNPTVSQLDKKLWKVFSEFIRLRDSDEKGFCKCFTCGRIKFWKDLDCGHGIGRQHKSTKYDEKNNQAQCKRCNGFEGGMREIFKQHMDKKYGTGTWDLMELKSKKPAKWSVFEYQALINYYAPEVEKMKKEKGL